MVSIVNGKAISLAALVGVIGATAGGVSVWKVVRSGVERETERTVMLSIIQRDLKALEGKVWVELSDHEGRIRTLEGQR